MRTFAQVLTFLLYTFFFLFLLSNKSYATDLTNSWSTTTNIYQAASLVSFTNNGTLYVLGGSASTGNSTKSIISTIPNSNGSISSWTNNALFPTALIFHSVAKKDNHTYILGGREENPGSPLDFVNKVFLGNANQSSLTNWLQQPLLPKKSGVGAAAIVGNRIYYAGGFNSSGYIKDIYMAQINVDGTLGAWTKVGDLPYPMIGFNLLEYKNNLILLGGYGYTPASTYFKQVYHATVNPADGSLSAWQTTSPFPEAQYRSHMMRVGDTILSVGGYNGSNTIDKVYHTTVHNDGTVDGWQLSSNHLPNPVHGGAMALVNSYLYLVGGYNANTGSYLSSVYYTKLNLETDLAVPLLKQTDPAWSSQLYDSANVWSPQKTGIDRWGCALTSATMVFNYHKITKLPDNSSLDPGTLNTWLKSQPDGYVYQGWVNWLALTRLSKLAKSKNPAFNYDALEYSRLGYSAGQVKTDLQNNIPGILEEPGHFVVARGTSGDTFTVNDPFYARTLLTDYGNTALSLGRFVPSHTNLSYILIATQDNVTVTVKDANNNTIGEAVTQEPLQDSLAGSGTNGLPVKTYYVKKPASGNYKIIISSSDVIQYNVKSFLYDVNGNVKTDSLSGIVGGNTQDTYVTSFDNQDVTNSNVKQTYTFDSLIADLDLLYAQGKITNLGVYLALKVKAQKAQLMISKSKTAAKAMLDSFVTQLNTNRGKVVLEEAWQILSPEVLFLKKSL